MRVPGTLYDPSPGTSFYEYHTLNLIQNGYNHEKRGSNRSEDSQSSYPFTEGPVVNFPIWSGLRSK